MPFTPSHVVAVLPLTRGRAGRFFHGAALAVGAMVPDLPYVVPVPLVALRVGARWTHAWFGPVTLDLALGLVVLAVWRAAVPGLVALAPQWLRCRVGGEAPPRHLVRDAVSVVVGASTHVAWDSFSHAHRWGTDVPWLTERLGPLAAYTWVQYGSGLLGLVVLGLWCVAWLRRTPERPTVAGTWVRGAVASGHRLDEATAVAIASRSIGVALAALLVVAPLGRLVPAWVGHDASDTMDG